MKHYLLFVSQAYSFSIMRPLQDAIRQQGDCAAWFITKPELFEKLHEDEKHLKTIDEVQRFRPRAVFAPGNWVPPEFPGVKVELFHGFGIEKKGHFKVRGLFDLYCTHGPATTKPFREMEKRLGFFHVAETGWPKMDPLFLNRPNQLPSGIRILYAPTFSPSLSSASALRDTIKALSEENDWQWIVKFHPKMDPATVQQYRDLETDKLTISNTHDISTLLYEADLMISDTSSVITEFLLLDKPVITLNNRQPGEHVINITQASDLEPAILDVLENPSQAIRGARDFIQAMHPYHDGLSSTRVLEDTEDFIAHRQSLLKRKQMNLWRKHKIRQRMKKYQAALR